jgi:hypothetical protein
MTSNRCSASSQDFVLRLFSHIHAEMRSDYPERTLAALVFTAFGAMGASSRISAV